MTLAEVRQNGRPSLVVENDSDRPIGRVRVTCLLQYEDHVPRSFVFEWTFIPALGRQWALDGGPY